MFSWWPKSLPEEFIIPLRTFGRRNIRWGKFEPQESAIISGGTQEQRHFFESLGSRAIHFDGRLSLAEKRLDVISEAYRCALANVLANGPKLFKIPAGFEVPLNEMTIPLRVKDYFQPFPAVIVQRENGDHQIVWQQDGCLGIFDLSHCVHVDFVLMLQPERTVESYLNERRFLQELPSPSPCHVVNSLRDNNDFMQHRFRASLNYLLVCMIEGIVSTGRVAKPRQVRNKPALKLANPEVFVPQNIQLFTERTISATTPETPGNPKRPHFRRAHWAKVRTGPGRVEHKLVLRRAAFINKHRLVTNADESEMTYTAEYRPRNPK